MSQEAKEVDVKEVDVSNLLDPINIAPWNSLGTPSCVVITITYNMHIKSY